MTDWINELDTDRGVEVAPSLDARISWFAFDEAIGDWLDITTLTIDTWAPSLKARLARAAMIYNPFGQRQIERPQGGRALLQKQTTNPLLDNC